MSDRTVIQVLVPAQGATGFISTAKAQSFEVYQPARAPSWLQDANTRAWNAELGKTKDGLLEMASEAIRARIISECAPDALVRLGLERDLEQFQIETIAQFRVRVQAAWVSKQFAGTAHGTLETLASMGYPQSTLAERITVNPASWSEFSVSVLASSITDWPAHLTLAVKTRIVRIVLAAKPAHVRLRKITAGPASIQIYKQLKWGDELTPSPAKKWGYPTLNSTPRKWGGGAIL